MVRIWRIVALKKDVIYRKEMAITMMQNIDFNIYI